MKRTTIITFFMLIVVVAGNRWTIKAENGCFAHRKSCLDALEKVEKRLQAPFGSTAAEDSCIHALNNIISCKLLSDSERIRPRLLLDWALKNRIGQPAHDIAFVEVDNRAHRLSDYKAPLTLLYFNDPDCDACQLVKSRLDTCEMLKLDSVQVIAIYPGDDEKHWRQASMPHYVINGWDKSQAIEEEETYFLPTLPTFYLLGEEHQVLIKNEPSLNAILARLSALLYPMASSKNSPLLPGATR